MSTCSSISSPGSQPLFFDPCDTPAAPAAAAPDEASSPAGRSLWVDAASTLNHFIAPLAGASAATAGAAALAGAGATAFCATPPGFVVCAGTALAGGLGGHVLAELADGKALDQIESQPALHAAVNGATGAALGAFTPAVMSTTQVVKDVLLGALTSRASATPATPSSTAFDTLTDVRGWAEDIGANAGGLAAFKLAGGAAASAGKASRKAIEWIADRFGSPSTSNFDNVVFLSERGHPAPPPEAPALDRPHEVEMRMAVGQDIAPGMPPAASSSGTQPKFFAVDESGRPPGGPRDGRPGEPGKSTPQGSEPATPSGRNPNDPAVSSAQIPPLPSHAGTRLEALNAEAAAQLGPVIDQRNRLFIEVEALRNTLASGSMSWATAGPTLMQLIQALNVAKTYIHSVSERYLKDCAALLEPLPGMAPHVKRLLHEPMARAAAAVKQERAELVSIHTQMAPLIQKRSSLDASAPQNAAEIKKLDHELYGLSQRLLDRQLDAGRVLDGVTQQFNQTFSRVGVAATREVPQPGGATSPSQASAQDVLSTRLPRPVRREVSKIKADFDRRLAPITRQMAETAAAAEKLEQNLLKTNKFDHGAFAQLMVRAQRLTGQEHELRMTYCKNIQIVIGHSDPQVQPALDKLLDPATARANVDITARHNKISDLLAQAEQKLSKALAWGESNPTEIDAPLHVLRLEQEASKDFAQALKLKTRMGEPVVELVRYFDEVTSKLR